MIPLGDDYSLPISKIDCRKYFGLQSEDLYILVGAYSLSDKRKGMDYLIESLKIVSEKLDAELMSNIHLLVVGNAENVTFLNLGFKCTFLNYLNHHDLIMAYKAADFYISPSINDMGPMMVSESVKSGTPVVSFDIGVAKDLIVNRKTGFIVNLKDAKLMADAIIELITLDREKYIQMSETCAKLGVSKLSYDVFNSNLIRIFS
jgi:glycosyltransferase involved in cell wall biosynthesis